MAHFEWMTWSFSPTWHGPLAIRGSMSRWCHAIPGGWPGVAGNWARTGLATTRGAGWNRWKRTKNLGKVAFKTIRNWHITFRKYKSCGNMGMVKWFCFFNMILFLVDCWRGRTTHDLPLDSLALPRPAPWRLWFYSIFLSQHLGCTSKRFQEKFALLKAVKVGFRTLPSPGNSGDYP